MVVAIRLHVARITPERNRQITATARDDAVQTATIPRTRGRVMIVRARPTARSTVAIARARTLQSERNLPANACQTAPNAREHDERAASDERAPDGATCTHGHLGDVTQPVPAHVRHASEEGPDRCEQVCEEMRDAAERGGRAPPQASQRSSDR